MSAVNKFGFGTVGTTLIPVWDGGTAYTYPAAATVLKVSSSDTDDDVGGTGALTVRVFGLDANYEPLDEYVTLTGQTAAVTTGEFLRVFRAYVVTAGTGGINAGNIWFGTGTVTSGVPATKYAGITAGEGQTLMAIYTVPAGKTALMTGWHASTTADKGVVTVSLVARPLGGVFRTQEKHVVNPGDLSAHYLPEKAFEAKTDIEVRAKASAATEIVSATFDLLEVDPVTVTQRRENAI